MKRLLNPYWIFATISAPLIALILLYVAAFQIIQSLLSRENLIYWLVYGGVLVFLLLSSTIYAILCIEREEKVHPLYGLVILAVHILFLYFFAIQSHYIIPSSVPRWMLMDGDLELYTYTFMMPSLAYGLFLLVLYFTPETGNTLIITNILSVIGIPVAWYFLVNLIPVLHLQSIFQFEYIRHLGNFFFINSVVVFLFFLVRIFYILITLNEAFFNKSRIFWMFLLAVVFPVLGLFLNNYSFEFIFGDYRGAWFYILAIVNGLLLCLPQQRKEPLSRMLIFAGRSIGYSFIIYFFIVFLPFLPLSVVAIIAFGTGFLMLTPLVLAIIQGQVLAEDVQFLKKQYQGWLVNLVFISGLLVLPSFLMLRFYQDRQALHQALDRLYETDFSKVSEKISTASINNVLLNIQHTKDSRGGDIFMNPKKYQQPYLSAFYRWYVLDNLTLSDEKIKLLSKVYLGQELKSRFNNRRFLTTTSTEIPLQADSIIAETTFDPKGKYYKTWVHLQIPNPSNAQREYSTEFQLPEGAWVSNYYLDIEKRREYGLLAEKKAALWVYQQIVSVRRDPGILYYLPGGKLALRVFPFAPNEKRSTGIEIVHKEPLRFLLDGHQVQTEKTEELAEESIIESKSALFIPGKVKEKLPLIEAPVQYHILLDMSNPAKGKSDFYINEVKKLLNKKIVTGANIRLSLVNYRVETFDLKGNWQDKIKAVTNEGGFFLELALKKIYTETYLATKPALTKVIVLSEHMDKALLTSEMNDYEFALGAVPYFFVWKSKRGNLSVRSFNEPYKELPSGLAQQKTYVRAYPNAATPRAYLKDDKEAEILLKSIHKPADGQQPVSFKSWENALELHAEWLVWKLRPNESKSRWLPLVKASFQTKVLSPVTSYISLENEAQKQALLAKQAQILKAKSSLDANEDEIRAMDEPEIYLLLVLAALLVLWRFRKI